MAQSRLGIVVCERLRPRAAVEAARYEEVVLGSYAARCDGAKPDFPVGPDHDCGQVRVLGGRCLDGWRPADPVFAAVRIPWCERVAVGSAEPELLQLELARVVLEWRIDAQRVKLNSILGHAYRRLTDYAMVQELVAGLAETPAEATVVEKVFEFLRSLLAPESIQFLLVEAGAPAGEFVRSRDPAAAQLTDARRQELAGFRQSYAWNPDNRGFRVSVRHRGRTVGVLAVDGIAPSEQREHFLDLTLIVTRVMGLSLSNARLFRDLKGPGMAASECAEDLRDALDGRKRAEERQAQLLRQVEAANKELEDFAYVVSHDLKAPLRAIDSLARWLAADQGPRLDEEGREQLGLMVQRVDRMRGLIDGILQYSRAGRLRAEPAPVDLAALVAEVVASLAVPGHIRVTVEGDFPTVNGDRTRLEQVFQNLLSNAVKYLDKPAGSIRLGCADAGEEWVFSVADNGPGIAEKDFARVWQLFATLRPRDSAGESTDSTGIGLSVVKKVVELYGGRVWLESKLGAGSTFYFSLPKAAAPGGAK
jgi:signal transduction histidine kinase